MFSAGARHLSLDTLRLTKHNAFWEVVTDENFPSDNTFNRGKENQIATEKTTEEAANSIVQASTDQKKATDYSGRLF